VIRTFAAQNIGCTIRPAVAIVTAAAVIAVGGWTPSAGHSSAPVRADEADPAVSLFNTTWP
jgi:hypothetical protein